MILVMLNEVYKFMMVTTKLSPSCDFSLKFGLSIFLVALFSNILNTYVLLSDLYLDPNPYENIYISQNYSLRPHTL
jgi:hypothetical protein